jgi:hypothetical protein
MEEIKDYCIKFPSCFVNCKFFEHTIKDGVRDLECYFATNTPDKWDMNYIKKTIAVDKAAPYDVW